MIKVGQDYSAGSGISIDDHTISVTGSFGNTYSAGNNISIYNQGEQLYISSKDWEQDIANASANAYNEAVSQIPSPFDPSYISGQVDNKLDTTAFTAWQNGQYSTDLQTIEGQINNKLDESAFSQVSASFLTAINIPESATWNEVSQVYKQASATYLTSVNIPESAVWQDVSTTVQSNSAQWAEGGGSTGGDAVVLTVGISPLSSLSAAISANKEIVLNNYGRLYRYDSLLTQYGQEALFYKIDTNHDVYAGRTKQLNQFETLVIGIPNLTGVIQDTTLNTISLIADWNESNSYLPSFINNKPDLSNSGLWNEISAYQEASASYVVENNFEYDDNYLITAYNGSAFAGGAGDEEVNAIVHNNSGTWNTVINKLDSSSFSTVSGDFLTAAPADMATTGEVAELAQTIFGSFYPNTNPLSFVSENWVTAQGYITGVSIPESATWNDVSTTVQTNSAQWAEGVTGEFVPQSAFDELKQSYDALSSLFATYSGQWLLPNEGV